MTRMLMIASLPSVGNLASPRTALMKAQLMSKGGGAGRRFGLFSCAGLH
jgi:hypothetical protein